MKTRLKAQTVQRIFAHLNEAKERIMLLIIKSWLRHQILKNILIRCARVACVPCGVIKKSLQRW